MGYSLSRRGTNSGGKPNLNRKERRTRSYFGTFDDVQELRLQGTYFLKERTRIAELIRDARVKPQNETQFLKLLKENNIDISVYRDSWGRPYRFVSATSAEYADQINSAAKEFPSALQNLQTTVTPVTRRLIIFSLLSDGPDRLTNTADDFAIARFSVVLSEQSTIVDAANGEIKGAGSIAGIIEDPTGAIISNTTVVLTSIQTGANIEVTSSDDGTYRFTSVPAGYYALTVDRPGFKRFQRDLVYVADGTAITLDVRLEIGSVADMVTVSATASLLQTESAEISSKREINSFETPTYPGIFSGDTSLGFPNLLTDSQGPRKVRIFASRYNHKLGTWLSSLQRPMEESLKLRRI